MNKLCLLSCALFLVMGTPGRAAPDTRDVSGLRADIAMQDYARTLKEGTPAQIAAWYAPDGQLLLPGTAPVTGPKGVEAFLGPLVKLAKVTGVSVHTELTQGLGTRVGLWGTYAETYVTPDGKAQTVTGRFSALWSSDGGGASKIVRLMMQPAPTEDGKAAARP